MNDFANQGAREEAAQWCARLAAPHCSQDERREFEQWRRNPVNRRAYLEAEQVIKSIDRLASADSRLRAMAERAYAQAAATQVAAPAVAKARRRWQAPAIAALAASILVAVIGIRLAPGLFGTGSAMAEYMTSNGEARVVSLQDGSIVHLDVQSEIAVRMTRNRRHIDLLAGRAFFEVAHDKSRPFSVIAGNTSTTALGTKFQVARQDQEVVVTLAEGSVAVDATERSEWHEKLAPGQQLSVSAGSQPRVRRTDADVATSWTNGRLIFRGTALAEALDEINRYASHKVRLGDPGLAQLPVAGSFIVSESDQIVTALAEVLPLRIVYAGDNEIILFRRYEAAAANSSG